MESGGGSTESGQIRDICRLATEQPVIGAWGRQMG